MRKSSFSDQWFAARVRAWARHGVVFDPVWYPVVWGVPGGGKRRVKAYRRRRRQVVLAVGGDLLTYRFSHAHPEREKRGQVNKQFLDPGCAEGGPCRGLPVAEVPVVVCLPRIFPNEEVGWRQFVGALELWLDALPPGFRYAVQMHNPEYVVPEYLECLRRRNVGHVLHHDATQSLLDQVPGAITADAVVVRREARQAGEGEEEWKLGVMATVRRCLERQARLYVSMAEETTLPATLALLDNDLAKLSPFRRLQAA